jgi:lysine 6-dehydrogenase
MKLVVLGAGMMGIGIVFDLIHSPEVREIVVVDKNIKNVNKAFKKIKAGSCEKEKCRYEVIDVTASCEYNKLLTVMADADAVVNALPYEYNLKITEAAIRAGVNLCNLGGSTEIVEAQLALDRVAKTAGITIIPDCGLAPGITNILAAYGYEKLDATETIRIRVGGLPQKPLPPLDYCIVFSPYGLINEYVGHVHALRNYKIVKLKPMTELEALEFKNIGKFEAFLTAGGSSTLPATFEGKVKELDYKTIRYNGHCTKFKTLIELGFMNDAPLEVQGQLVIPKDFLAAILDAKLRRDCEDMVLLRVTVDGEKNGKKKRITYELIEYPDSENGLTAMMRTTAFPASVTAQMLAHNTISKKGVLPPELVVPRELFIQELRTRGIVITESIESM